MASLSSAAIAELLRPYLQPLPGAREPFDQGIDVPATLYEQLGIYLELLLKWNARTNLTAIRAPEEMVTRHFGESLFLARSLCGCASMLDFGSGAGFPGLPAQLMWPELRVTLAESQSKKAAFLRECVRVFGLATEVWGGRVAAMESGRTFDVVTLRAVDSMESALSEAGVLAKESVVVLGTAQIRGMLARSIPGMMLEEPIAIPNSRDGLLWVGRHGVKG